MPSPVTANLIANSTFTSAFQPITGLRRAAQFNVSAVFGAGAVGSVVLQRRFDNPTTGTDTWRTVATYTASTEATITEPENTSWYQIGVPAAGYTTSVVGSVGVTVAGTGYTSIPTVGFSGGSGSGAAANAAMQALTITSVQTAGTGYVPAEVLTLTGGTASTNATLSVTSTKVVSAVPVAAGTGYVPADTITLTGGTFSTAAILAVTNTKVATAALNAGGTGYTNGTQTLTVNTGTGTQATVSVTVAGGIVTGVVSVLTRGVYTANPTLTGSATTGGGGTGCTLNLTVGVNAVSVNTAGVYTVNPASPVAQGTTSGSGTGATFTPVFGVNAVSIANGGVYTALPSNPVSQGSTTGVGTGFTVNIATWGVNSVIVTNGGTAFTSAPTVAFTGGAGSSAAATAVLQGGTISVRIGQNGW